MAEMVGSLVVGELVSRASSFLISKHKERSATARATSETLERLEMAQIRMEAALAVSARRGQVVTDVALLRWRRELRRGADECAAAAQRWELRALEEEEAREALARAWLPARVARLVASFVSSLFSRGRNDEEPREKVVERFEKLADGAGDFLRCVQSGSASAHRALFEDAIVRKPAVRGKSGNSGKDVGYSLVQGGSRRCLRSGSRKSGVEIKQVVM